MTGFPAVDAWVAEQRADYEERESWTCLPRYFHPVAYRDTLGMSPVVAMEALVAAVEKRDRWLREAGEAAHAAQEEIARLCDELGWAAIELDAAGVALAEHGCTDDNLRNVERAALGARRAVAAVTVGAPDG